VIAHALRTGLILLGMLWALPWTLFGLLLGGIGLLTGGSVQRSGRTLEFWGGAIGWMLDHAPIVAGAIAITFGHVVLAANEHARNICRSHERVHVKQYERWGPLFVPAYLFCSLVLWLTGRDAYRDNPFEIEAYRRGH
jgi:hypothetical protein